MNGVQLTSWQALKNGMASTGKVMLKSLLKPTNLVIAGVTAMIVVLHKTNEAVEEVRERADELSNTFNNNKSDIKGYKDKIEDLYKTINDSGSSLEEVTTARQTLMTVQDELIDKFGDEKETIDLVTQAIYGQSSALDELIQKQWRETKNEFNESDIWNDYANWQEGYSDNIDRMVHEMENAWGNITMSTSDYWSGEYDDIIKRLEEAGWEYSSAYENFVKGGSVEDLYEEILDIQTLVGDDMPDNFLKSLTKDANKLKATLDNYEGMWDNYILNDKIFADENLADSWKEVNEAYAKYQNVVTSGDKTAIEEATSGFATSINEVLNDENVSDSVKDYFKDMYPALYREVEKWEFKTNIIPEFDTSGLQGKTQADVLEMLQTDGTQDGEDTFNSIIDSAIKYGLILDDDAEGIQKILGLLVEWGILQGTITDTAPQNPDKIPALSISETIDHLETKVKPALDSLKSAYQDIFTEDGFTLDNVGVDMLNSVKEAIAEINEIDGVNVASSAFEDFARVLTYTETTEEQAHDAFNDLVADIINGTDSTYVSSDAFNTLVQSLEEMGVTNANEALIEVKNTQDQLIKQGINIDNITAEEAEAFLKEAEALGISTQWFKTYTLQKAIAENPLDTTEDIEALENLCNVLGVTGEMLEYINSIKYANRMIEFRNQTGMGAPVEAYQATIENAKKNIQKLLDEGSVFQFDFKYDGSKDDSKGSSSKDSSSTFDWIKTEISNMEDSLDQLDKHVADTYSSWDTRNQKLAESIAKANEAITLQDNAAKAYMAEANSVGLSSHYKALVQKGALNIEDISDKDLADKISEYQDLFEKSNQCTEKANELRRTLNELSSSEKWDLLKSESDADIDVLDKRIDSIQTSLDKLDLNGKFANESYYNNMIDLTQSKISSLISQETELQSILNNMTQGTEAYDTMFAELMDIRNQIAELENECIEFNNNVRDLDWEIFEFFEDSISRVREEFDFLKDLLSDKGMFDDNGNMTKYADATMGLHYANIETYKQQAQDYYEEMQDLQQQLVNGASQDVLEQYREYENLHRDMVLAIQDEQKAVLDLVQNGYEEQLKILQEINQATLDRMDAERDLYNFQKDIEEKTQEKTSIERQIDVLRGDNSEEAKSKLQQLEVKLSDVNADIEETLYEQQRNDTQAMLDALESDYQEWMNIRMDDENALLEEIKGEVTQKSDEIMSTLTEVASEYGTTLSTSLTSIFGSEKPFDSVVAAINNLIAKISGVVGADGIGSSSGNSSNGNSGSNSSATTNTKPSTITTPSTNTQQTNNTQSKSGTDGIFIYQKSVYPKDKLNKEKSIVDRLKYNDFASDFQSRATYYKKLGGSGTYTGSSSQNRWLISKMKEMGYASGTNYAKKGLHWTQENGDEIIIRKSDGAILTYLGTGDKVVNPDATNHLYDFANDPQGFLEKFGVMNYTMPAVNIPTMPNISSLVNKPSNTPQVHDVNMTFELPNVKSADDFINELQHSSRFEKIVQSMTLGNALGGNSMNKYRY